MSGPFFEIAIGLTCFGVPLLMGLLVGRSVERRHFADLDEREDRVRASMIITQNKKPLYPKAGKTAPQLMTSEVVIATDYLKTYLASWRAFFGGEIRSYRTMLERARREAVLRLVEEAQRSGYNAVGNIRLSPCEIGGTAAMAVIVASGTAYHSTIEVKDPFKESPGPSTPALETGNPYQADPSL